MFRWQGLVYADISQVFGNLLFAASVSFCCYVLKSIYFGFIFLICKKSRLKFLLKLSVAWGGSAELQSQAHSFKVFPAFRATQRGRRYGTELKN